MTFPAIHLYDTRRRAVVPFEPVVAGKASIYTCGPTVYGPQHLGNMRSQLLPDLLRRVLLASGLDVTFVTNVTDVGHLVSDADEGEDKVEKAAAQSGQTVEEITGHWTEQWANDRRRLGMLEPDLIPYASKHIDEQIAMIRTLEEQGRTYVIDDGVYFDVSTFPAYADFAHLDLDELEQDLARIGEAMDAAERQVDRLVFAEQEGLLTLGNPRRPADNNPVLGPVIVALE